MASDALGLVSELSDDDQVQLEAGHPSSGSARCEIDALSDDEAFEASLKRCKPARELSPKEVSEQFRRLRAVASSKCKCSSGCCAVPFKEDAGLLDRLLNQRMMLLELPKLEADRMVFRMLKKQKVQERRALELLGHPVCQRAFRLLLGIGKHRMERLRSGVLNGESECPIDQRFRPQKHERLSEKSVKPQVVEFLQKLYHTVAEPLPEAFAVDANSAGIVQGPKNVVRRRGKRPRHLFKHDVEKKNQKGHAEDAKFLPPGTILDYLELCRSDYPTLKIGRKTFCRATCN
eukprot:s3000_g9.t1